MKWQKAFLVLLLVPFVALAQQTQTQTGDLPPGPPTVARSELPDQNLEGSFNLIQLVLEFASGTWTPLHSHGGMVLITVLEGEVIMRMEDGPEHRYAAGDTFVEGPGEWAEVGNDGNVTARIVVTALLPEGAELTTVRQ